MMYKLKMAAAKSAASSVSSSSSSWSKWCLAALAVGTPVVLGVGFFYYRNSKRGQRNSREINREKSSSVESLDDGSGGGDSSSTKKTKNSTKPQQNNHLNNKDDSSGSLADKAEAAKIKGNKLFKEGRYHDAIKLYTEAIALCPPELSQNISTFYQNRAAAYEKLKTYSEVIKDSNKALELNPKYTKALNRRAKAYESTNELENALLDATAICILEEFQNQSSLVLADRVLKELGKERAKKEMKNRKQVTPSKHFIRTYFSSFDEDPILKFSPKNEEDEKTTKLSGFLKAHHNLLNRQYDDIIADCTKELEDDGSCYLAESLLLRATFFNLRGQSDAAFKDLETLLNIQDLPAKIKVNALIKLASLKIQHELIDEAFQNFTSAEEVDSQNADIYHHRGQVNLLLERMEDAVRDFEKATTLNPNFPIAAVQRCYADYRHAFVKHDFDLLQKAMDLFEKTIQRFPRCAEGYILYAQALVDQQEFEKADRNYEKALNEDPNNANIYVHKGLLQLHVKQDYGAAVNMMKKAIEKDDRCEFAYETLGALEVQRGDLDHALELFDRALALSRTELELAHLHSLRDAAVAQKTVAKRLGIAIPRFDNV